MMAAVVIDEWSFWRADMRARAARLAQCSAWGHVNEWDWTWECPTLTLDWDGCPNPEGGPVARLVATGNFEQAGVARDNFAAACELPLLSTVVERFKIVMRFGAPCASICNAW